MHDTSGVNGLSIGRSHSEVINSAGGSLAITAGGLPPPAFLAATGQPATLERVEPVAGLGGVKANSMTPLKYIDAQKGSENSGIKVLGATVDTYRHWFKLDDIGFGELCLRLAEYKEKARECEGGGYQVPGLGMVVMAAGRRQFPYVVRVLGEIGAIGEFEVSPLQAAHHRPQVRARLFAPYLFDCVTLRAGVDEFRRLLLDLGGGAVIVDELVGTVDIAVDVAGFVPTVEMLQSGQLVTYADYPTIEAWDYETIYSMRFGGKKSALSIACYDKTREIREQSPEKAYLLEMYRVNGWDGIEPVYRLEARYSREFLHDVGVNSFVDLDLAALLVYALGDGDEDKGYISLRSATGDSNASRWPVAALWCDLVAGALRLLGKQSYLRLVRSVAVRLPKVHRLLRQVEGCMASLAALTGCEKRGAVVRMVDVWSGLRSREPGLDWSSMVAGRRNRFLVLAGCDGLPVLGG